MIDNWGSSLMFRELIVNYKQLLMTLFKEKFQYKDHIKMILNKMKTNNEWQYDF